MYSFFNIPSMTIKPRKEGEKIALSEKIIVIKVPSKRNKKDVPVFIAKKDVNKKKPVGKLDSLQIKKDKATAKKEKTMIEVNWVIVPRIGDAFMLWWYEGIITDLHRPSVWFVTYIRKGNTSVTGIAKLWDEMDQAIGYYKKGKTVYNWDAMKLEFMESDYLDVTPFLQYVYRMESGLNWNTKERVKWWGEEKRQVQKEMKQKAYDDFKTNLSKEWTKVFEKLEFAHVNGLENLADMIIDQGKLKKRKVLKTLKDPETGINLGKEVIDEDFIVPQLNHAEITNIIKHIKLEKGEPIDIVDTQGKSKARSWLDDVKKQKDWVEAE